LPRATAKFSFDKSERLFGVLPLSPKTAKALTAQTANDKATAVLLTIFSMVDRLIDILYKIKRKNNHKSNRLSHLLVFI
jgi:hypothetical protein